MPSIIIGKGSQLRHSTPMYIGRKAKPTLSADYIVGLVDGEGCFYVNVPASNRYNAGARVELCFHIKLKAQDRAVLERVKETLGCGAVYFQKEQRQNHTQCFRYTVGSHRDILAKVIPFFSRHPLQSPSKRKSFEAFLQIAKLVGERKHLSADGIRKIRLLKTQMNQRAVGLA